MPTQIAYQRELSRRLYEGELPVVAGANTSSTGTTITDLLGNLNYSSGDTNFYDGIYVTVVTSAEAARGETRVTRGGWAVTGSLTVDPSVGSLASGDLFVLSKHPPRLLQDAINRLLRNTYQPTFFPLSLHIMGNDANDMEPSSIATDYSSTNATNSLESAIVFNGAQSLQIDATSAGGFANTGNIGVSDGQTLYAAVMMYSTSGDSGTFRVVNVTNSNATIEEAKTDEPSFMEMFFRFSAPSGCEQIDFRLIADANTDVIYAEDFQVWRQGAGVYPLPSWIEWPEQMIDVRGFPRGTGGPASDNDFRANERASIPLNWHIEREDRRGASPVHIWVEATSARPYIYAHRPFAELSAAGSTSNADLDAVVEDAAFLVLHPDRAEQYLSVLRQHRLGGAVVVAPKRVPVR
ncbi:hypothetical protein LCGC14_1914470 [marine sediment metagenome]|uniref:Uncharacterized protein n=1 Tax=marine sediment metagenome TaxID=412755 RepID=A0A0F9FSG2_9ZZZZ